MAIIESLDMKISTMIRRAASKKFTTDFIRLEGGIIGGKLIASVRKK